LVDAPKKIDTWILKQQKKGPIDNWILKKIQLVSVTTRVNKTQKQKHKTKINCY
jgi:hypothetical protein